ncbi:MAG: hypothetical protein ACHQQS_07890 [Thermoanaerobaculales bacterium]
MSGPFVIVPLTINNTTGDAIHVDGTNLTKSLALYSLSVAGNATGNSRGIALTNINRLGQQAIAAATPINVVNAPPPVACNVAASEGGGGISTQNGNVWTGNAAKLIDSCITQQYRLALAGPLGFASNGSKRDF